MFVQQLVQREPDLGISLLEDVSVQPVDTFPGRIPSNAVSSYCCYISGAGAIHPPRFGTGNPAEPRISKHPPGTPKPSWWDRHEAMRQDTCW